MAVEFVLEASQLRVGLHENANLLLSFSFPLPTVLPSSLLTFCLPPSNQIIFSQGSLKEQSSENEYLNKIY